MLTSFTRPGIAVTVGMALIWLTSRACGQSAEPLAHLRDWSARMNDATFSTPPSSRGEFRERDDINRLVTSSIADHRHGRLRARQTVRLARKTQSLDILTMSPRASANMAIR
jgi:hypothetical protein